MKLPNNVSMIAFGIALAVALGAILTLLHKVVPGWGIPFLALAITALAWALWTRKPKQPKPAPGIDYSRMPAYGTKRWARMMFKNGYTTIEELSAWYAANPNAPED